MAKALRGQCQNNRRQELPLLVLPQFIGQWRWGTVTLSEDKSADAAAYRVKTKLALGLSVIGLWSAPHLVLSCCSAGDLCRRWFSKGTELPGRTRSANPLKGKVTAAEMALYFRIPESH
jgi:hypothetical protein